MTKTYVELLTIQSDLRQRCSTSSDPAERAVCYSELIAVERALEEALPTWHVVTSLGGVVLGVFGSALLSDAQECARRAERQTGFHAFVNQVRGARPTVGSTLSVVS